MAYYRKWVMHEDIELNKWLLCHRSSISATCTTNVFFSFLCLKILNLSACITVYFSVSDANITNYPLLYTSPRPVAFAFIFSLHVMHPMYATQKLIHFILTQIFLNLFFKLMKHFKEILLSLLSEKHSEYPQLLLTRYMYYSGILCEVAYFLLGWLSIHTFLLAFSMQHNAF